MPRVEITEVSYADGRFVVDLGDEQVTADRLLVATGRTPVVDGTGLETVGVDTDVRFLPTDDRMRVLVDDSPLDWLHAVGDVVGKGAYSHTALYQSYVAVQHILGMDGPAADFRAIPRVTFTDPEVGAVGLTEQQAREEGREVRTGVATFDSLPRATMHQMGNEGLVKLVAEGELVVGATSVGPMGGEVLAMLSTAVHARVPVGTLQSMIYAYPTFHEAVRKALADLG
jgi:pyruvate/2-oxoglutarate dehydrogenase complex dihydrolipoamide dehydrogenase (E3) component